MRTFGPYKPEPVIARGDRYTILAVDDREENRTLFLKMLEALGYRAITAAGGIDALEKIHRKPCPDLIIMDVDMPGMSGLETIAAIRALSSPMRNLPIVAAAVETDLDSIEELWKAGADAFLTSPFNMPEMTRVLLSMLGGRIEEVPASALRTRFGIPA